MYCGRSIKSGVDKGTLLQLRNLLNLSSVPGDPEENMTASEDFISMLLLWLLLKLLACTEILTVTQLSEVIAANYVLLPYLDKYNQRRPKKQVTVSILQIKLTLRYGSLDTGTNMAWLS